MPSPGTDLPVVPFQVKIADLGFARKLRQDQLAATFLGTPLMMAPEILEKENYDHTADVWSLGCVFYEMMTGFPPFTGNNLSDLQNNIQTGIYFFPKSVKFSLQGLSFLNSCLQYDPSQRPSLNELMNHPYITLDNSLDAGGR